MPLVLPFRTSTYARTVYLYGTDTLARIATVAPEYVEPIKQYAAVTWTDKDITEALEKGYITQSEYDSTLEYKYPSQPEPEV